MSPPRGSPAKLVCPANTNGGLPAKSEVEKPEEEDIAMDDDRGVDLSFDVKKENLTQDSDTNDKPQLKVRTDCDLKVKSEVREPTRDPGRLAGGRLKIFKGEKRNILSIESVIWMFIIMFDNCAHYSV